MASNDQRGFILVATLWILAAITIAAGYFAERVNRSIELTRQKQNTAAQLVEFANTRADILFRLGTTPMSWYGLGEQPAIALDNRPYRGAGDSLVRLQDNRGLLNVNFINIEMMSNFLWQLEVPFEKRAPLIDKLFDYTDVDDLRRLNGAEAAEYAALDLPPPPNDWLITPSQLANIIGWRDLAASAKNQRLLQLVTTGRIAGFNPNTAPLEILASLPGGSRGLAEKMSKLRREKPFISTVPMIDLGWNSSMDPESFIFFSSDSIRITHQNRNIPWMVQYNVTLTPMAENAPWRFDYYGKITATSPVESEEEIATLAARTALSATPAEAL